MRTSASSRRIMSSPSVALAKVGSRSSGSALVRSPRFPPWRNRRYHVSSSWAGTWVSRETWSNDSPRRSRSTISCLRCTLHRAGSAGGVGLGEGLGTRSGFFAMATLLCARQYKRAGCPGKPGPILV
jgi:hypothetical protein